MRSLGSELQRLPPFQNLTITDTTMWFCRATILHACWPPKHMLAVGSVSYCLRCLAVGDGGFGVLPRRPWMRAAGIRGLVSLAVLGGRHFVSVAPYEQAELVEQHSQTVPDQGNHLQRLSDSLGVRSVPELANKLGYDGPFELLSMWACLFGAKQLRGVAGRGFNTNVLVERAWKPWPRPERCYCLL